MTLKIFIVICPHTITDGVVAQLGERLNGIEEVRGSIPLSSTNNKKMLSLNDGAFFLFNREENLTPTWFGLACVIARMHLLQIIYKQIQWSVFIKIMAIC